ncbi:Protein phosphatase 1 regulatory subunit pprA [Diplonema papillatum]|nr:Protein phosphatase 1 regulatory subunit pprA [Diplonema papillatum]
MNAPPGDEDGDVDWEAAIDRELELVEIGSDERVPRRELTYDVVKWDAGENGGRHSVLLSGDPMAVQGVPMGVAKPPQKKAAARQPSRPASPDVDIAKLLKQSDAAEPSDERWAAAVENFYAYVKTSEEHDRSFVQAVDRLKGLKLPDLTREHAGETQPVEEPGAEGAPAELTLREVSSDSSLSDDEREHLASEEAGEQLRAARTAAAAADDERAAARAAAAAEEFRAQRQRLEDKAAETRDMLRAADPPPAALPPPGGAKSFVELTEELQARDEIFTAKLALEERSIEAEASERAAEWQAAQERKAARAEARRREEDEAERRQESTHAEALQAKARESARLRRDARARADALRARAERLAMEGADVESLHALRLGEQRQRRAEAVAQAKAASERAAISSQLQAQRDAVSVTLESQARRAVDGAEAAGRTVLGQTAAQLDTMAAAQSSARDELESDYQRQAAGLRSEGEDGWGAVVEWHRGVLERFGYAAAAVGRAEIERRAALAEAEHAAFDELGTAARHSWSKVEEVVIERRLYEVRHAARQEADASTRRGEERLQEMLRGAAAGGRETSGTSPSQRARARSNRKAALALQHSLRLQWQTFFDPGFLQGLQRLRLQLPPTPPPQRKQSFAGRELTLAAISVEADPASGAKLLDDSALRTFLATDLTASATAQCITVTFEGIGGVVPPLPVVGERRCESLVLSNNAISSFFAHREPPTCSFVDTGLRGIRSLDLTDNKLSTLDFLAAFPSLTSLTVDSNRLNTIAGISACPEVVAFSARHNCVQSSDVFKSCSQLRKLDLFGNNISELELPDISFLVHLNVARNALTDVANVFRSCPLLLEAHLNNNRIAKIPSRLHCVLLQSLLLRDNLIEEVPDLTHMPCLRYLDLGSNRLTDVQGIAGCLHLAVLDVSFNNLTDSRGMLAATAHLARLERLSLNDNPLWTRDHFTSPGSEFASFEHFRADLVRQLPSLRFLNSDPTDPAWARWGGCPPPNEAAENAGHIVRSCLVGASHTAGCTEQSQAASSMAMYDSACLAHIAERQRSAAGDGVDLKQAAETAERWLQQHLAAGSGHLANSWGAVAGAKGRQRQTAAVREGAAVRVQRWWRRAKGQKARAGKVVKLQALARGFITRSRLKAGEWVDADAAEYPEVAFDFPADGVDLSRVDAIREIFHREMQQHAAASSPRSSKPPGRPPQLPQPQQQAPAADLAHSPSFIPAPPAHSSDAPPSPGGGTRGGPRAPEDTAAVAWASGMNKRGKKFEKMKKKRIQQEFIYGDRTKTLDQQKQVVTQTMEAGGGPPRVKKRSLARMPPAPADLAADPLEDSQRGVNADDLELQSMTSTLRSTASGPLPPLTRVNSKGRPG